MKVRNTQSQGGRVMTVATFQLQLTDLTSLKSQAKKADISLSAFIRRALKLA